VVSKGAKCRERRSEVRSVWTFPSRTKLSAHNNTPESIADAYESTPWEWLKRKRKSRIIPGRSDMDFRIGKLRARNYVPYFGDSQ